MKTKLHLNLYRIILLIVVEVSISQQEEWCSSKYLVKSGITWHPDCRLYYDCNSKKEILCPDGKLFDVASAKCKLFPDLIGRRYLCINYWSHGQLRIQPPSICDGKNKRFEIPNECFMYVQCYSNGRPTIERCSSRAFYSGSSSACVPYVNLTDIEKSNCKGYESISFDACSGEKSYVNAGNCGQYWTCTSGKRSLMSCDDGKFFSNKLETCVNNISADDNQTCKMPAASDVNINDICHIVNSAYIGDMKTCRAYYSCLVDPPKRIVCPKNMFYNVDLQRCTLFTALNSVRKKRCLNEMKSILDLNKCPLGFVGFTRVKGKACFEAYKCDMNSKPELVNCTKPEYLHPMTPKCISSVTNMEQLSEASLGYIKRCKSIINPAPTLKTVEQICKEHFYFYLTLEYEGDCTKYYVCELQTLTVQNCESNLYFDSSRNPGECVSIDKHNNPDKCHTKSGTLTKDDKDCPNMATGKKRLGCTKYINCNLGSPKIVICQKETYFTTKFGGKCVSFEKLSAEEQNGVCHSYKPVIIPVLHPVCNSSSYALKLIKHPSDCQKFYACQSGVANLLMCPVGTVFKENNGTCMVQTSEDVKSCNIKLPTAAKCSPGEKKVLAETKNCEIYYECSVTKKCPEGQIYDNGCRAPDDGQRKICLQLVAQKKISDQLCPEKGNVRLLVLDDPFCSKYYQCSEGKPSKVIQCDNSKSNNSRVYANAGQRGDYCVSEFPSSYSSFCSTTLIASV